MIFIYGDEEFLVDYYSREICDLKRQSSDIVVFDSEASFDEIENEICSLSLFSNPKTILIKDSPLLYQSKQTKELAKKMVLVLENKPENVGVIFSLYDAKIAQAKKSALFEYLEKNAQNKQASKIPSAKISLFLKKYLEKQKATIDDDALFELIARFPNNLFILTKELDKYALLDKHITLKMLANDDYSVSDNIEFALSDAIIKKHSPTLLIKKYQEQKQLGTPYNLLFAQIFSILETAIEIHILKSQKIFEAEIAKILKIHPFRIKLINEFLVATGFKKISNLIKFGSQIDLDVKDGLIDEEMALDLFILELTKTN